MQKNWLEFLEKFRRINSTYIERLDNKYPDLTPAQFRICLYIYAGYTTNDIADQLGLSKQAVENHRYRLRKKFNTHKQQNLTTTLIKI